MSELRFAFRRIWKTPGFAVVVVVTLALGIGANTAFFSVINSVLIRPLPYPEPGRLVSVCESNPGLGREHSVASMAALADWREHSTAFQELAAATVLGPTAVSGGEGAEMLQVSAVSANFFPLLGVEPLLGRPFLIEEETPAKGDVVLLSERLWRARYGARTDILNQTVTLGDHSFTVVGVMPAALKLFEPSGVQGWERGLSRSDLWRPLPVNSGLRKQRSYRAFLVLGRLKSGVSLIQAATEMKVLAQDQARQFPESNAGWSATVRPWNETIVRESQKPLLLLFGAVGLVLVIATANLANLYLARMTGRRQEIAMRIALGAGRGQVARQFLAESLLLACLGGVCGLLLGHWSLRLLAGLIPADIPRAGEIRLDGWVLAFTFATSLFAGTFFGLAPLPLFWRDVTTGGLKPGDRGTTGGADGHRLRGILVATQVAMAMVLLSGFGLLGRSLWRLSRVDLGFRPERLTAVDVSLSGRDYSERLARVRAVTSLLDTLANRPGGDTFAAVDGLPLDAGRSSMEIALTTIEGTAPPAVDERRIAGLRLVSPGYFQVLGIPLVRGRFFQDRDTTNSTPVTIINEAFARRYFPGMNPLGRRLASPDFGPESCEIVGVVKDIRHAGPDASPTPETFRPLSQDCFSSITLVTRNPGSSSAIVNMVRTAGAAVDRNWPVYNPRMLEQLAGESLAPRRFALLLMGLFAGLALLIAVVGIYGVVSCMVGERTREIGIRLAVGAQRRDVLGMMLKRGMSPVAIGGLVGILSTIGLVVVLRHLFYEIGLIDLPTLAGVVILLAFVSILACWLPARRAACVNPVIALRND